MPSKVSFKNGQFASVEEKKNLSEQLNIQNSPVLFGCRTGICGTCLVHVHSGSENLNEIDEDEREFLDIVASDNPEARLACKLFVKGEVELEYLGKD